MKALGKTLIRWSPNFAYAIGLLTTDGNISPDRRHLDFTSRDREQIINFMMCLGIKIKISSKFSGFKLSRSFRIQFGDVLFCNFLKTIGLMPNKSKILGVVKVPQKYFFDFLRGHFDGDGTFYSYFDPRWRSSYMFYTSLVSASKSHVQWLQKTIYKYLKIKGHITGAKKRSLHQLKYAKAESLQLLSKLYYNNRVVCLSRKRLKIEKALMVIDRTI